MKSIILTEEEIVLIQSFIQEAATLPIVEKVVITPSDLYYKTLNVTAIWNSRLYHQDIFEKGIMNSGLQIDTLDSIIQTYNDQSNENILYCNNEDDFNYSLDNKKLLGEITLLSGAKVYRGFYNQYDDEIKIENADQIIRLRRHLF